MAIEQMPFGRLGHLSTRTLFGGASLSDVTHAEADRALDVLLEYGINHIDVAASYGDAELRIAPWLKRYPDHFFVATKTGQRTYKGGKDELHRSLERMGVDYVDLWQLHNLADAIQWEESLAEGGVIKAAVEARKEGLIKGIGVTGHGLQIAAMHHRSLERFEFDSVLLPYNYITMQNEYYAGNFNALLETCQAREVAVQTIKAIARSPWWGRDYTATTWYEPLQNQEDIDRAVWWVLSNPQVFLNTAGDLSLLPRVLDAASRFSDQHPEDVRSAAEEYLSRLDFTPLFV